MLSDLEKNESIIHISGREYRVRYSLNCLLCLENEFAPIEEILKIDYDKWDHDTVIHLIHAAMCDMPWNRKAVNNRDFKYVKPDLFSIGQSVKAQDLPTLRLEIADAILHSFPESDGDGSAKDNSNSSDEGHLRALAVDVIGISEKEFWNSSYKDLHTRINKYLEVKGMKEMPIEIKMYDKED